MTIPTPTREGTPMTALAPEITPHLLSQAVIAYLGRHTHPFPQRNAAAVEKLSHDWELLRATRATISRVLHFDSGHLPDDHVEAAVTDHARRVCPELTAEAIDAIVWNYRCGWR